MKQCLTLNPLLVSEKCGNLVSCVTHGKKINTFSGKGITKICQLLKWLELMTQRFGRKL